MGYNMSPMKKNPQYPLPHPPPPPPIFYGNNGTLSGNLVISKTKCRYCTKFSRNEECPNCGASKFQIINTRKRPKPQYSIS